METKIISMDFIMMLYGSKNCSSAIENNEPTTLFPLINTIFFEQ